MSLLARLRSRLRHPSYVDTLYRARCECGWIGPIREGEMDAQDDRGAHWACTRDVLVSGGQLEGGE